MTTDKNKLNIWLVDKAGFVLVKNFSSNNSIMSIDDLSIQASDTISLLKEVESQWRILCTENQIKKINSFSNAEMTISVYKLVSNFSSEEEELITENYNGKFIHYTELNDYLKNCTDDPNIIASYKAIIEDIDKTQDKRNMTGSYNFISTF